MAATPNTVLCNTLAITGRVCIAVASLAVIPDTAIAYPQAEPCGHPQVATLHSPHAAGFNQFGASVAISGSTLAVGDTADSTFGPGVGAVFMFERREKESFNWTRTAMLVPADAGPGEFFGRNVALSGNVLVAGQPLDDDKGTDAGAAYVFERLPDAPDTWQLTAKLTASDGAPGASFGLHIAIQGDTIAIGAIRSESGGIPVGAVYVFGRTSASDQHWVQLQVLRPENGHSEDFFGSSVALTRDILAVGAFGDDTAAFNAGAVYVYGRRDTTWELEGKLLAPDASASDFLNTVAIADNQVLAGALGDDDLGLNSGAVYVFGRDTAGWTMAQKLHAVGGQSGDEFGISLAAENSRLIVATPFARLSGQGSGAVFEFRMEPDTRAWLQAGVLTPFEAGPGAELERVSISEGLAVVGAKHSLAPGAAYVFETRHGRTTTTFCTPSPAQLPGCVPEISAVGIPTASGTSYFTIASGRVPGGQVGLFVYSHGHDRTPVTGVPGMCIPRALSWSSSLLFSNGTFGECDGLLVLDWNELLSNQAGVDPQLTVPGTLLQGQFAYFGFGSSGRVAFTDAVAFVTCP